MNFFSRYKNLIFITGFILLTLFFGYLLFVIFFKPQLPPPGEITPPVSTTTPAEGLPIPGEEVGEYVTPEEGEAGLPGEEITAVPPIDTIAKGGLTAAPEIGKHPALGLSPGKDGQLNYYNKDDGKFYRIDKDGKIFSLSDKVFYEAENVTWAPGQNKAIIEYPDDSNIIYDFDKKTQITLPKHWKDFDFSPAGDKIVAKSIGINPENRWLITANNDGSKITPIEPLGAYESTVYPDWSPNRQIIAMYTKGTGLDRQEVFFLGQNEENFKSMTIEGRGFQPQWSTEGDRLLYSVYSSDNDLKPDLWVVGAEGDNIGQGRKKLNIETWAEKCTFAGNTEIYCAVPDRLQEGAGLFEEMSKTTNDRVYKIDIVSGIKRLVATPETNMSMSDLILSEDGKYLFFTDNTTGRIHKIQLGAE